MPNRKSQAETVADSSTKDEAAQSVRRHNTNTIVSGSYHLINEMDLLKLRLDAALMYYENGKFAEAFKILSGHNCR